MVELDDLDDPIGDVESLILAAGGYVQPSEDLRPRVLEAVRSYRDELHAQRRIWQAAIILLLITALPSAICGKLEPDVVSTASANDASLRPGAQTVDASAGWDAVDFFQATRRRQAAILRTSF